MTKNLQDITARIYNDIAGGNPKTLVDALADDVVLTLHGAAPYAGRVAGKAKLLESMGRAKTMRTAEKQTIEKILSNDDTVVVVGHEEFTVVVDRQTSEGALRPPPDLSRWKNLILRGLRGGGRRRLELTPLRALLSTWRSL